MQWLYRQLVVARSGYYAWRRRQKTPGRRQAENAVLTAEIQAVYEAHRGFYGSPRVHQELREAGRYIGLHRVARLMRRAGLQARTRRPFRPCKSASRGAHGVADNLLQQEFKPPEPNRFWAGDITYISTKAGWRHLVVWIDLFSRRVVGWKLDERMDAALVIEALNRALGQRQVKAEQLLIHTDQGSQYRATDYRALLKKHQIRCSMSAKGGCWDTPWLRASSQPLRWDLLCTITVRS
jgi:putative transposase